MVHREQLDRRVALITGAGTGIGAATALELSRIGIGIALMGRRPEPLSSVATAISLEGGRSLAIPGDVRDADALAAAVAHAEEKLGVVDILVTCAAVVDHEAIAVADTSRWAEVISTNVLGTMYAVRAVLPGMLARGAGHIVIVASMSGRVTYVGEPAYVASKHALVAFADCLRKETTGGGIRTSVIEPGLVDTPLIDWESVRRILPGVEALRAEDCARVIRFCLEQRVGVGIDEIVVRPAGQAL